MTRLAAQNIVLTLGGARVLDGLSLAVESGQVLGLVGPNGAGKTTLMRVLAGLIAPDSGGVLLDDRPLSALSRHARARHVAYMPQETELAWPIAVHDLVALGRLPYRNPFARLSQDDESAITQALAAADVSAFTTRHATTLSAGERARVLLARALAGRTSILLVDEPVAALDPFHQLQVMELLRDTARGGVAVLVVLHDLTLAARFCDRVAVLFEGRLRAEGSAPAIAADPALAEVFRVDTFNGRHDGEPFVVPWQRRR